MSARPGFGFDLGDVFAQRHIGINDTSEKEMLKLLEYKSLDDFIQATVPKAIRTSKSLKLPPALDESKALEELKGIVKQNKVFKSYIGQGYYNCITPAVIQRNILENPAWYTQYTPYQAEISQGRMESLLNFQTMVMDFSGLDVANASVLDEATAAAEAMSLADAENNRDGDKAFFIAQDCFPQTIEVVKTRALARDIKVIVGDPREFDFSKPVFGALIQYPNRDGEIFDYRSFIQRLHEKGILCVAASDLLALTLVASPKEMGVDIAVGSSQRFGVPLGYGGPHAGFLAAKQDFLRKMPGRIIGVSKDAYGRPALRLTLQTREQHIRREKATSNICTAQALLANMAAMYAVYHGPQGLKRIAKRVHGLARAFAHTLTSNGLKVANKNYFDTVRVNLSKAEAERVNKAALAENMNVNYRGSDFITVSFDETSSLADVEKLASIFASKAVALSSAGGDIGIEKTLQRQSSYLSHKIFNSYHTETELMRYIRRLESYDLSLTTSMISLGSCTMKLNAAAELMPVSWPEINGMHPFAPKAQVAGYHTMIKQLEDWLCQITGFSAFNLAPNSGAQGELAGLLVIRAYQEAKGQGNRRICLIPSSAHGTNPASAVMAGLKVVVVNCDKQGNVDLEDLRAKAEKHASELSSLMITYPSTHGVFEEGIKDICAIIHQAGGQVYMDGANMNAQVGLCLPNEFGADVCHLNLHKTFCIPHGGGGPGVGPIGVAKHLVEYLPKHSLDVFAEKVSGEDLGPVTAAPYGSASILPISWMYIRMMGEAGLKRATSIAILNANYIAKRLEPHYPILYKGKNGLVAHECIIDLRHLKKSAGVDVEDVAKRLMDYGFHAPTMAWPVAGTMMVEPTESECKEELDRFCDALIAIRAEIRDIENGKQDRTDNLLKNAPHTMHEICTDNWQKAYSREQAAFPSSATRAHKFWPRVARVDNAFGDRNFVCSCPSVESYSHD